MNQMQSMINKGNTGVAGFINHTHVFLSYNGQLFAFPTREMKGADDAKKCLSNVTALLIAPEAVAAAYGQAELDAALAGLKPLQDVTEDPTVQLMLTLGGEPEECMFIPESEVPKVKANIEAQLAARAK